jgi:hypothetical protein
MLGNSGKTNVEARGYGSCAELLVPHETKDLSPAGLGYNLQRVHGAP